MDLHDRSAPAAGFLAMHHERPGFLLPNAWDPGSARILEEVGFQALATTSAGIAFSLGRPDGTLGRDETLRAVAGIVAAVRCPVSADLEDGFGPAPDDVAATVAEAAASGVVGVNLEDRSGDRLLDPDEAAARIAATRASVPRGELVLNARTDTYLSAAPDEDAAATFEATVDRAARYVAAGADCVFVPGVQDPTTVAALVQAIPAPLNVVAGLSADAPDVGALRSAGVARISVGGSLARAALALVERAGRAMLEEGRLDHVRDAIPHGELQRRFSRPGAR